MTVETAEVLKTSAGSAKRQMLKRLKIVAESAKKILEVLMQTADMLMLKLNC